VGDRLLKVTCKIRKDIGLDKTGHRFFRVELDHANYSNDGSLVTLGHNLQQKVQFSLLFAKTLVTLKCFTKCVIISVYEYRKGR
jgi:hypothetical protein